MNKKVLSGRYYYGLVKILSIYILSVLAYYGYLKFVAHSVVSWYQVFIGVIHYEQYAWYVEMYLGLFLIIPFLNIIYWNLTRSQKKILVITFLFLTSVPSVINFYDWSAIDTFVMPLDINTSTRILPFWWSSCYPITYYFIGAYLDEYKDKLRISRLKNILLLMGNVLITSAYCFYSSNHGPIVNGPWTSWWGLVNVVNASLLLLLLLRIQVDRIPVFVKRCIVWVSRVSFGTYLVSVIFDKRNYEVFNKMVPLATDRLPYYFVMVPINFICSCLLAFLLYLIYDFGVCIYRQYFSVVEDSNGE